MKITLDNRPKTKIEHLNGGDVFHFVGDEDRPELVYICGIKPKANQDRTITLLS